jgi:hypothetical protein
MDVRTIDVLLAVYNGGAFLPALLDSLLAQTEQDFRLLVGDDRSTDRTVAILQDYRGRFGGRLELLPLTERTGTAKRNFARLADAAEAPYAMLCDQDDVWLPHKIAMTLQRAREAEAVCGADTPILVHTDLTVVDDRLNVLHPSFWRFQFIKPERSALNRLLLQNVVTGCTVLVNRALLSRARPIPDAAIMHDWWFALVASAMGRIEVLNQPTILYRQHGGNDTGAKRWSIARVVQHAATFSTGMRVSLEQVQEQAAEFLRRFGEDLAPENRATVSALATMPSANGLQRRWRLARYGLWKIGVLRNFGLLLRI